MNPPPGGPVTRCVKIRDFEDCHPERSGDSQHILIKTAQDSQPRFGTAHAGGGPASRPPRPPNQLVHPTNTHDSSFRRGPVRTIRRSPRGQGISKRRRAGSDCPQARGFRPHRSLASGEKLRAGHQCAAARPGLAGALQGEPPLHPGGRAGGARQVQVRANRARCERPPRPPPPDGNVFQLREWSPKA